MNFSMDQVLIHRVLGPSNNPTLSSSKKKLVVQLVFHYSAFALRSPVERNGPTKANTLSGFVSHCSDVEWRQEQLTEGSSLFFFFVVVVLICVLSFSANLRKNNNQKGRIPAK